MITQRGNSIKELFSKGLLLSIGIQILLSLVKKLNSIYYLVSNGTVNFILIPMLGI